MKSDSQTLGGGQGALAPLTIRVSRAAEITGLSEAYIRQLCKIGALEFAMVGQTMLVDYQSLRRLTKKGLRARQ